MVLGENRTGNFIKLKPAMMEQIYQKTITVGSELIDRNGHVNNVVYVEWMQELAIAHARSWDVDELMVKQGTSWFARKHVIEYFRPVHLDDHIEARTWIESAERVKCLRRYEFLRNGQKVASGETEWVYVDVSTGRPRRIPEEMHTIAFAKSDE